MQCSQCQHENRASAKFCAGCGNPLLMTCPSCGNQNPPGAAFCDNCGTSLRRPADAPSAAQTPSIAEPGATPTAEAERRQLTVMFCDLVGSTPLSEQLDPEDYRDVVRAYHTTCAEVSQRFEGHIAQLLGDALLVYFGWPQAHEDDAQRAVRAGLGMLDAMGTLNTRLAREKGIRLAIRVGLHTGLVVVGEMGGGGHQEQLALGDTPNVASRVQGMAEPNTVLLSAATFRLIQGFFDCDDLGLHQLKGVAMPVQVYRAVRESGAQSRLDVAVRRGLTPLVGRAQEIVGLVQRWAQAQEGRGQVVVLSGEAGIGKSRLLQALKQHVTGTAHMWAEHRCSPYHTHSALYPVIDLWERLLAGDKPAMDKVSSLERLLGQYRLPLTETVPLMAALLSLPLPEGRYPPLSLSPQRQRQRTMEVLMALLLDLAESQPVLFLLEDLHWADPSTLEFLGLLIDQLPTASILTVLTARPAFEQPWGNRSYLTQVTLNRLPARQVEHMLVRLTGGKSLPDEVVQQIVTKTDGVPLFVEELTKAVLESGVLRQTPERYELIGPLPPLAIPATLHDSLMARLDRLVTAKGIAQIGATIGRQFAYALLRDVAQLDNETLQRELAQLVAAELVYQRGVPPQATYTFKHALIQDTAYQSLLKQTRQQYHQRIALAIAGRFPETADTQPEVLAHHYTEAGDTMQAMPYWQRAGLRAFEQSAPVEATQHLTRGLDLLATLPASPERAQHELALHNALGTALSVTRGYAVPEVARAYSRAHELCAEVADASQLIRVLRGLQGFYTASGDFRKALEVAEQCFELAQRQGLPAQMIGAHFAMGLTLYHRGEFIRARLHLEQGIDLYDPTKRRAHRAAQDPGVSCLCFLAWTLWSLGYPDQALQRSHEASTLAQTLAHPFSLAFAIHNGAVLHAYRREVDAAYEQNEVVLALGAEQGYPWFVAHGTMLRGWTLAAQGQHQEGIAELRQGLAAYKVTGARGSHLPYYQLLLAEAYGYAGQPEAGLAILDETLELIETTEEREFAAELYRLKGELLRHPECGRQHAEWTPEACFQQAMDIARGQQAKSLELRAAVCLARLWQSQGRGQAARDLLVPVYDWFTEGFDTLDLQEARALLDEIA